MLRIQLTFDIRSTNGPVNNDTFFWPDVEYQQTLESSVKIYKRRYDRELRHVKLILMLERRRMSTGDWLNLVQKTKESIKQNPEDFFGAELPSLQFLCQVIDMVFEGFLEDQRLLANQTSKGFRIPGYLKS